MRILLISNTFSPDSGWGRYAKETKEALERQGHEIISPEDLPSPLSDKKNFLLFPWYALKIWGEQKQRIDIIHCIVEPYAPLAWMLSKFLCAPYFITAHGTLGIKPLSHPVYGKIHRYVFQKAHGVICVSSYTQNVLKKAMPGIRATVIHSGTSPLPQPLKSFEKKFSVPEDASPVLLTVGAIKERKGQLDTTEAVARLKEKYPNIFYAIVGDAGDARYVGKIEKYIEENDLHRNVKIVADTKTDEELAYLYSRSDIFLLNSVNHGSHFEGFGLVILEANQFGKPAVGSRDCGIEDALKDGVNGYLANQKDPEDIARTVEKLTENPLSKGPIQEWYSRFDWNKTAESFVALYRASLETYRAQ